MWAHENDIERNLDGAERRSNLRSSAEVVGGRGDGGQHKGGDNRGGDKSNARIMTDVDDARQE
jgi:hypothetical protein